MAAVGYRTAALALACAACTSVAVDARTFEGTEWHVSAINGHRTPASAGNYVMRFDAGHVGGQFGCNHFGGDYRARGDVLTTTAIRMTMMACADPAMSFESWGTAVLQAPMRISWRSDRQLTLSNSAGSIVLERQP